jgi:nucleoid-associated protein YgaU
MSKTITAAAAAVLLVLAAATGGAQSLLDNQFYKQAQDLLAKSQSALDAGDYDGAAALAQQAKGALAQSDQYVVTTALAYRAQGWLGMANDRIAYAKSIKADVNFKDAFDKASTLTVSAKTALDAKSYQDSIDQSKSALDALKDIKTVTVAAAPAPVEPAPAPVEPAAAPDLPEYYVVRLVLPLRDCFWRIAAYPFVYNDPWKWRLLYEANKSVIGDPQNPDLIEVGTRFVIPSLAGEKRSGDYDPSVQYPALSAAQ